MRSIFRTWIGWIVTISSIALVLSTFVVQQVYRASATTNQPFKPSTVAHKELAATTDPILFVHGIDRNSVADCHATWADVLSSFSTSHVVNGSVVQWSGSLLTVGYYKGDIHCNSTLSTFRNKCKGYYDSVVGTNNESIRHLGCELAWFIYTNYTHAAHPKNVEVAGYSMGGLIARWALARSQPHNPPFPPAKLLVRDVVELDSPNGGFSIVNDQACGGHSCVEGQEMKPNSRFISDLATFAQDPQGAAGTQWTLIGSDCSPTCSGQSSQASSHVIGCLDIAPQSAVAMMGAFKIVYQVPCYNHQGLQQLGHTFTMLVDPSSNLNATILFCNSCSSYPGQTSTVYPHAILATLYALVEAWTSPVPPANWSIISSPNLGIDTELNSVAAVSANDIWAVGSYNANIDSSAQTYIEHWKGSRWSIVPSPDTSHTNYLEGVTAVATNDVWAVGGTYEGSNSATLIEHWDGASWSVVPSPSPSALGRNDLFAVAAVAANDVWAVGVYFDDFNADYLPLFEHWNGTNWTFLPATEHTGNFNEVRSVAVISSTDIWAVGDVIEHWDGTHWSIIASPDAGELYGVAALATNDVWAVGSDTNESGTNQTIIEHWNGTTWSSVIGLKVGTGDNTLSGIVAISATSIWAVGSGSSGTLIEYWDGFGWNVVTSPSIGTNTNTLNGAVTLSKDTIWSVGTYLNDGNLGQTLIEQYRV